MTSAPAGATVSVNGQPQGVTPLRIRLSRKLKDQVVRIESPGSNPLEIKVKRGVSAAKTAMDVMLGAAAGVLGTLVYSAAAEGPMITTKPRNVPDSNKVVAIAVPVLMIGIPLLDLALGGGYTLHPAEITVTLTKAEGPPRVDTIVLDAKESRNIRWIRIHRN